MKKKNEEEALKKRKSEEIDFTNDKADESGEENIMNTSEKKLNININSQRKTSANEEFDELKKNLDESNMEIEKPDQDKVIEPLITEESDKNLELNKKVSEKQIKEEENNINIGNKEKQGEIKRITKDEDRVKGKLKGNVYATYFRNNGGALFVITLSFILIS